MDTLLSIALRLQQTARVITSEREKGVHDQTTLEELTVQWVMERQEFAAMSPASPLDALSQLHSIRQAAAALFECRENPEAIDGLATEVLTGINSLISYHERLVGRTRDEIALYDNYRPTQGVN